tara:strand:- start:361 stop:1059 length:699 start_codon:yes stop_codon:yes gene_type:complete
MINIINKLSIFIFNKNNKIQRKTVPNEIYDEEKINKQKLYEKWCKKEKWLLHSEGILLLLSINPSKKNILDKDLVERINNLKEHANECVRKNLLEVLNINKPENEWEVKPVDLYHWATISRINIPDEFNTLMTFITQSLRTNNYDSNTINHGISQDGIYKSENEIVLGAAISLLINSPGICRDDKGNINSKVIASKIIENEKHWFDNSKSKLSEIEMIELIEKYVRMSKVLY